MTEYDIKDYEVSIGGQKLDLSSVTDFEWKADADPADHKGKIEMKLIQTSPQNSLFQLMQPPKQESDNTRDCLMVYQAFKWEIARKRFKIDNPTQQAQELAEKISHDFGLEKCPIRIDKFEVDSDGAIALDVVFLMGGENGF